MLQHDCSNCEKSGSCNIEGIVTKYKAASLVSGLQGVAGVLAAEFNKVPDDLSSLSPEVSAEMTSAIVALRALPEFLGGYIPSINEVMFYTIPAVANKEVLQQMSELLLEEIAADIKQEYLEKTSLLARALGFGLLPHAVQSAEREGHRVLGAQSMDNLLPIDGEAPAMHSSFKAPPSLESGAIN